MYNKIKKKGGGLEDEKKKLKINIRPKCILKECSKIIESIVKKYSSEI